MEKRSLFSNSGFSRLTEDSHDPLSPHPRPRLYSRPGDALFISQARNKSFVLYGLGRERVGIEFSRGSITFYVPSNQTDHEVGRELALLRVIMEEATRQGVPFQVSCLNMPGGAEVDRLTIQISRYAQCADCDQRAV